jgi:hypothetical protein
VMTRIVMAVMMTTRMTAVRMTLKPALVRSMVIFAVTRTTAIVLPWKQAWPMMTVQIVALIHHGQKTYLSTSSSQSLRVWSKYFRLLLI